MKILEHLARACRMKHFAATTEECDGRWFEDDLRYHRRVAGFWIHSDEIRERPVGFCRSG